VTGAENSSPTRQWWDFEPLSTLRAVRVGLEVLRSPRFALLSIRPVSSESPKMAEGQA
jgi:hypothetical protein